MARTALPIYSLFGSKNPLNPGADVTMQAADQANDHEWLLADGRDLLFVANGDVGGQAITIKAVADPTGRTEDATVTVGAGQYRLFGPIKAAGWAQTDGKVYVDLGGGVPTSVTLAVLRLPAN
jgi:hypothetical protein